MKRICAALALLGAAAFHANAGSDAVLPETSPVGVIGVRPEMLSADYWIARAASPEQVLLTRSQIEARNRKSFRTDPNFFDLSAMQGTVSAAQLRAWLKDAAGPVPDRPVDRSGKEIPRATFQDIERNVGAESIRSDVPVRFGLSVRRAVLRTYPTAIEAFASMETTDYDVFQGGVLFPGEPVAGLHASMDGQWLLVLTRNGPAWVAASDVAFGSKADVISYVARRDARIVTGDQVRSVFTPEAPQVSEMVFDMGTRLPLASLAPNEPVNGQGSYTGWAVSMPARGPHGELEFKAVLVRRTQDTSADYLPMTRANILRQAFKFLGERYGWGHLYNARDCSGLTSEVYRSMGLDLAPNSGAQGRSTALPHEVFDPADSDERRLRAVAHADVGDLIVVPGHVLMIVGFVDGQPYVIQDVPYAVFRGPAGALRMTKLNGVSITPLLPLYADNEHTYVQAMTSLVHVSAHD